VCQLDSGYDPDVLYVIQRFRDSHDSRNDEIDVRRVCMVSNGNGLDPEHLSSTHQFGRYEHTVTEN
jgi:hypothetical protein